MSELVVMQVQKSCPNARIHDAHLRIWHDDSGYRVHCRDCGMRGPVCMTEEEAVRDWDAMVGIDYRAEGQKLEVAILATREQRNRAEDKAFVLEALAKELAVFVKLASHRIFGETFPGHPEYVACEAILEKIEKAGVL